MEIFSALAFVVGKILLGLTIVLGPLFSGSTISFTAKSDLWRIPTTTNLGEIVTTLNPVKPQATTSIVAATSSKTAVKPKSVEAKPVPAAPSAPAPAPVPSPSPAPQAGISGDALNEHARASTVNILCLTGRGSLESITGSGVVIDPRGVILTNAHIAEYFLLRDYLAEDNVQCVIRTGSPARAAYTARLLYISQNWIADNVYQISSPHPSGTGENDYALLVIDGRTGGGPLPVSFSYIRPNIAQVNPGEQLLLAAYPASLLGGVNIETNLYATSAFTTVGQLYVFHETPGVDLFSAGGTILSQGGSSGGAAVRLSDGTLAGIFATAQKGDTTGSSDLRAITLTHIDSSLRAEGQGGLAAILSGNIYAKAELFAQAIAPALTQTLLANL